MSTKSLIPKIMNIYEELKKLINNGPFRTRQITLTDEIGRVYLFSMEYQNDWLRVDSVYITPTGQGGFTHLTDCLMKLGVHHLIISHVVNAKLAEHLARRGWELKASYPNWVDFHLYL